MSSIQTFVGVVNWADVKSVRVISSTTETIRGKFIGRTAVGFLLFGGVGAIVGATTKKDSSIRLHTFDLELHNGKMVQGQATDLEVEGLVRYIAGAAEPVPDFNGRYLLASAKRWLEQNQNMDAAEFYKLPVSVRKGYLKLGGKLSNKFKYYARPTALVMYAIIAFGIVILLNK